MVFIQINLNEFHWRLCMTRYGDSRKYYLLVMNWRTDAKAETPVLWPAHAKSWLIGKDSDRGWDGWMASPTPRVHSDSRPSSQSCHLAISSSVGVFFNESTLCMRWPKHWSFSFSIIQIPYDYTVEVRNRFKGLDLIECLLNYGRRFVTLYRR